MFFGVTFVVLASLQGLQGVPVITGIPPPVIIAQPVCSLPKAPGPCTNYSVKWYYNTASKTCQAFLYGGCFGNANRFDSRIACEVKCADTCTLPQHVGRFICLAYIPRWWFNPVTKLCQPFIYGGCAGTRNNFLTEEACYKRCDKTGCSYVDCGLSPCPGGYKMNKKGCRNAQCLCDCPCHKRVKRFKKNKRGKKKCKKVWKKKKCPPGQSCVIEVAPCPQPPCAKVGVCRPTPTKRPPCHQDPDSGCGKKKLVRWYYDTFFLRGCTKFFYSGAGGNDNRFKTEAECKAKCP